MNSEWQYPRSAAACLPINERAYNIKINGSDRQWASVQADISEIWRGWDVMLKWVASFYLAEFLFKSWCRQLSYQGA